VIRDQLSVIRNVLQKGENELLLELSIESL